MATATAASPVVAVKLPAKILQSLMQDHSQLAVSVARLLQLRYHHTVETCTIAFAPVEQRILSVLSRLHEDFGTVLPVTRREVAELAGTTVETAIRITRQMQRQGILRMRRGQITLLELAVLERKKVCSP